MRLRSAVLVVCLLVSFALAQGPGKVEIDPSTGRALGAQHVSPEALKRMIDQQTKTLIVDVRDPEEFQKNTIRDAVNIPLAELERRLQDIPKDTTLVFT
jgi:predicted sulfurtransferase